MRDRTRRERFDLDVRARLIAFLVPAGECCEEDEAEESENDGDDAKYGLVASKKTGICISKLTEDMGTQLHP